MKNVANGYYTLCVWITRIAYVNLLWVMFSLMGGIIFGLFPSTSAMFTVIRKWLVKQEDVPVFQTFWNAFKKAFIQSNVLGYLLLLIGYFLTIELNILQHKSGVPYQLASFGVLSLMILYIIVVLYFFPIFAHFNLKTIDYVRWPFIIGMVHPILTLFLMAAVFVVNYITYLTIPALLFFTGGSITAFILTWGVSKTFPRYEEAVRNS